MKPLILACASTTAILLGLVGFGPCQVGHEHGKQAAPSAAPKPPAPAQNATVTSPHTAHAPAVDPAKPGAEVTGYAHVPLESVALPALGFATAKIERRPLVRKLRTTGWVTVDETLTSHVHAKVRGYVVSSHGRFIGAAVKRGEPLVSLYSQGVLSAELELLALVEQQVQMRAALPDSPVGKSLDPVLAA
jgi:membrane fusion protein, copper/silver efflux system